jgi:hypothetical protein
MPYVALEAAGAQVPIVATDVGGVPEIFGPFADRLGPATTPRISPAASAPCSTCRLSCALIVLSPFPLATAISIKLESPGPIFFRQNRYGFNNELAEILKFRSMHADKLDFDASKLVTRDDPRVTRVGCFIRKSSIDELPQLFNVVFKGDLSLVGPRPHAIHAKAADRKYDEVVDGYFAPSRQAGHHRLGASARAGVAKRTLTRRSSSAPITISTISRTGRSCSISISWRSRRLPSSRPATPFDATGRARERGWMRPQLAQDIRPARLVLLRLSTTRSRLEISKPDALGRVPFPPCGALGC